MGRAAVPALSPVIHWSRIMAVWTDIAGTRRRGERASMAARTVPGQPDQDQIERFVERLRQESDDALAPVVQPLLQELRGARSYAALQRRLAAAVGEMDLSRFVELMARAGFSAHLAGAAALHVQPPHLRRRARKTARRKNSGSL